jgi:hypothetical protein
LLKTKPVEQLQILRGQTQFLKVEDQVNPELHSQFVLLILTPVLEGKLSQRAQVVLMSTELVSQTQALALPQTMLAGQTQDEGPSRTAVEEVALPQVTQVGDVSLFTI